MSSLDLPAGKKLVLVVDDDPSTRLLAASTLENAGYRVEEAENGKEALSAFLRLAPGIVLLDVMMPEMDGFTACRELRRLPGGQHVPVMMMTGLEDVESIHSAYEAGATDFITKPINWVILVYRVAHLHRASETFDELFRSETKNRALLNAIPDNVFRIGRDGTFLDMASPNRQDLLLPRKAHLGRKISEVLPPELAPQFMERIAEALRTKEVQRLEYPLPLRGADAFFEARYVASGDDEVFSITRNITERKVAEKEQARLEEQLRQSQKMEAVGQLAGGVAHDFNNILTAILGYTDLLLNRERGNDATHHGLLEIRKAGDRAANLTRQLLAFSRRQTLQPKVLNLNDVVAGTDKLLRRLIGENIDIRTILEERLGNVKIDPGQVEQVIMNLAVNARDAMPAGGTLTLETANVEHGEGYALRHRPISPGPYVMLAITDQGTGMNEETRSRIFEPFFTTKEKGKGTGLGLATVYGIVNQSGGHIWVYSEPGKGTTFKVYLPRVDEAAEAPEATESLAVSGRGETVLLVEDDLSVRDITRIVLCARGYEVLEAVNGEEGLEIAGSHTGKIDLVLTDVVMPNMGGLELVEKLAPMRPDAKVLFISGYPENAAFASGALSRGASFLMKPFRAETLLNKVRNVLDSCTT